ncbi:MAG: glycosyltransferase family 1 protein [Actinomycetota bacterium]
MRVLYDTTAAQLTAAGVGRYVTTLADALAAVPAVEVQRVAAPAGGRVAAGLRREAVYYPAGLGRLARRRRADVVHCPGPSGPRRMPVPLVVTVHDVIPLRFPHLFTRVNAAHFRLVAAPAARRAARVIVSTEFTGREVADLLGVDPRRIAVTPWGIDPRFHPVPVDRDDLARRHGLPPRYVLCVGTLEPRKNLVTLLRAFREVRRRHGDVALAAVGGAGWRDDELLAALGGAPEGVVRLGFVPDDDLVALYAGASCFAFPSLYEGFGFPPIEAMACGAPVVASDASCLPEVLGDAALLVAPHDEAGLAGAITRVLDDPALAADLRARGLARAASHRWDECARLTAAAYADAMADA